MMKRTHVGLVATVAFMAVAGSAQAQKVTYEEHVMPVFRNACLKCHNSNDKKGDLDLATFSGVLKGGGGGVSVVSGDADASKLVKAITHSEEPFMPPNSPKMADKEIELIKKWIDGGLLENSGSKAIASNKPKVDLSAGSVSAAKPEGPPPMPQDLLLEPIVRTERTSASTGMAASPWAPLVALGAPKQVLLYNTDSMELAGVLPFPEGYPSDIKFSRNGKLVLAGGGYGARAGMVVVWDVTNGERILTVGEEFDAVLAADISADQKWIALGGPSRMVSIYSTADGEREHHNKKHTDWVTAMEFSPNSKYLATGDRNGGVVVWESASGREVYTLNGHRGAITAISWRGGSDIVASASEDGSIKFWEMKEGTQARTFNAHNGGVLWARFTHDGRLVSCGRDKQIATWDAGASRQKTMQFTNQLPVRATFSHDGKLVIGSDYAGEVAVWTSAEAKLVGPLNLNPPSISERITLAEKRVDELLEAVRKAEAGVTAAEAELGQAESVQTDAKKVDAAREKIRKAKEEVDRANADVAKARAKIAELRAAEFNVGVYRARDELSKRQQEQLKLVAAAKSGEEDAVTATSNLAKAKKRQVTVQDHIDGWNNVLKQDKKAADKPLAELKSAQQKVAKLEPKVTKIKADLAKAEADLAKSPDNKKTVDAVAKLKKDAEPLQKELEAAQKSVTEIQAAGEKVLKDYEHARTELANYQKEAEKVAKQIKDLAVQIKKSELDAKTAKANAEKLAKELEGEKVKVEQMAAAFKQMKGA